MWYYGDEQFSPNPLRVIAVRFAQELPRSGPEDELVISDLEISYQLDSKNGWLGPTCSELLIDCFMEEVERYSQNVVRTRLSGAFDGVTFSATYSGVQGGSTRQAGGARTRCSVRRDRQKR